jgi:hypothetical protein
MLELVELSGVNLESSDAQQFTHGSSLKAFSSSIYKQLPKLVGRYLNLAVDGGRGVALVSQALICFAGAEIKDSPPFVLPPAPLIRK